MGQFHSKEKKRMKALTFDYDNLQGIASIYAIPVSSYLRITPDYVDQTLLLELIKREMIITIPVYAGDSFQFSESQSLEDGGDVWEVAITGVIPKRCPLNEKHMNTLERGDWLVLSQDSNGTVTLSGTTDVPLKFTHSRTTGSSSELNGSHFTFSAKEPDPSLIVSNDIFNI